MKAVPQRTIEDYVQYWERLNVRSVRLIEKLAHKDLAYTDPFYDERGLEAFEDIMKHYLSGHSGISIKVLNVASSADDCTVFLRWEVSSVSKRVRTLSGMSEVVFGADSKVIAHHNFWDTGSQIMVKLPFLKQAYKSLKKRITGRS